MSWSIVVNFVRGRQSPKYDSPFLTPRSRGSDRRSRMLDFRAMTLSYARSPVPVRPDIEAAHAQAWSGLARPGEWWSGAQRIAIAEETRRARGCSLCRERKAALSPFSIEGVHDSSDILPETAVDVAHRVTTDPGRLSRKWFDGIIAAGLGDGHYVEALGVVVRTVAIDAFCRTIGAPAHELPAAEPGEPTGRRPERLGDDGAWVPMQPPGAALYEGENYPNVGRALSLVPDEVRGIVALMRPQYMDVEHVPDPTYDPGRAIDRAQIELIAGRVSALNECFY